MIQALYASDAQLVPELRRKRTKLKRGAGLNNQSSAWAKVIQPKLKVNKPGDVYEQEADRVADEVMRKPKQSEKRCSCGGTAGPDGECAACRARSLSGSMVQAQATPLMVQKKGVKAKSYPYNVSFTNCDKNPFQSAVIKKAVRDAYNRVKNSNCVKSQDLKDDILAEFDGLNVDCEQDKDGPCGQASRYFTQTVNIYPVALNSAKCGPLKSTILHEIIHLTEWWPFGHGDLTYDCEKSCFNTGPGDAKNCK